MKKNVILFLLSMTAGVGFCQELNDAKPRKIKTLLRLGDISLTDERSFLISKVKDIEDSLEADSAGLIYIWCFGDWGTHIYMIEKKKDGRVAGTKIEVQSKEKREILKSKAIFKEDSNLFSRFSSVIDNPVSFPESSIYRSSSISDYVIEKKTADDTYKWAVRSSVSWNTDSQEEIQNLLHEFNKQVDKK